MHRVVMENELGRLLDRDEIVHHIDGDKKNNELSNLQVMSSAKHSSYHSLERWEGNRAERIELVCPNCKRTFKIRLKQYGHRKKNNKTEAIYCSIRCATIGKPQPRKLNPNKVREIRKLAADGVGYEELSERYDVHWSTIKRVVNRQRWASVK